MKEHVMQTRLKMEQPCYIESNMVNVMQTHSAVMDIDLSSNDQKVQSGFSR